MKVLLLALNAKFIHTSLALRYIKAYCHEYEKNIENNEERRKIAKEREKASSEYYNNAGGSSQGSLKSKANMVKQYNEKNNK